MVKRHVLEELLFCDNTIRYNLRTRDVTTDLCLYRLMIEMLLLDIFKDVYWSNRFIIPLCLSCDMLQLY